jgi:hypothetical protein
MDVLRHVGNKQIYKKFEYPPGRLQINLLRFYKKLPKQPKLMEVDGEFGFFILPGFLKTILNLKSKSFSNSQNRKLSF